MYAARRRPPAGQLDDGVRPSGPAAATPLEHDVRGSSGRRRHSQLRAGLSFGSLSRQTRGAASAEPSDSGQWRAAARLLPPVATSLAPDGPRAGEVRFMPPPRHRDVAVAVPRAWPA